MQGLPQSYDVVKPQGQSNSVRLGISLDNGDDVAEAVLRYQGVLGEYDLPPVKKNTKLVTMLPCRHALISNEQSGRQVQTIYDADFVRYWLWQ